MNYLKIYQNLISKAQTRAGITLFEVHHILPRSMGGNNEVENLVSLTPREHFIAHYLLWKIYKNSKMTYAFWAMAQMTKGSRISARTYEKLRIERIQFLQAENTGKKLSEETKRKIGEKSKGRVHSEETKRIQSEANKGKILSEETKQKIRDANLGKKYSPEVCEKISVGQKGRISPRKGVTLSEETKQKISESQRRRLAK